MVKKKYYTTIEIAKILGISRVSVFNKIKKGEIKAEKIGRMFVIPKNEFEVILGKSLTPAQKRIIDAGIKKTVKEYGKTLELLGNE